MRYQQPSIENQLALCQAVAQLVRARLPIAQGLESLSSDGGRSLGQYSQSIKDRLAQGKSLAQALVQGEDRSSRILAATLAAGERSGFLDQAIESWTQMVIANRRATSQLRSALVYPGLLIVITIASLAFTIWHLLPEYERGFVALHQQVPGWFFILHWVRDGLWWEAVLFLVASLAPLAYWHWHHNAIAKDGLPRDRVKRERIHALSAHLASLMIDGRVPMEELVAKCLASTGKMIDQAETERCLLRLQARQSLEPLSREVSALLVSLDTGLMSPEETSRNLRELSEQLNFEASLVSERQARFLPMLVALVVGTLVILTYVLVIYLPWIDLLVKIIEPVDAMRR